jgi:hypothetical protein
MSTRSILYGGVIISPEHRTHGLIQLLAHQMRHRLELVYYPHPNSIETDHPHDFIIVLSLDSLAHVIHHYEVKNTPVPPLIHIDDPHTLDQIDHKAVFPGVTIAALPQPSLDDPSKATLNLTLFSDIIHNLFAG